MAYPKVHTPSTDSAYDPYDAEIGIAQDILQLLFGPAGQRAWAVRFWDGSTELPDRPPRFTLVLRRPGALRRMLLPPSELALGEAYLREDIDLEGSAEAAARLIDEVPYRLRSLGTLTRLTRLLLRLPKHDLPVDPDAPPRLAATLRDRLQFRQRASVPVRAPDQMASEFYGFWLDARLIFSAGYYRRDDDDLDTAQKSKLEHICRKLRLKPGERLLDIGCGWGGLVQYAAAHYGVQAFGITSSEAQAALARSRITTAGLFERCQIEVGDYRDLAASAPFDKVVSAGAFEHVGRAGLPDHFAAAYRLTRPGGLFLNHSIAAPAPETLAGRLSWLMQRQWKPGAFLQQYYFHDPELLSPHEVARLAELAGFEAYDVENLRHHFTLTLRQWIPRLEARRKDAAQIGGEATYRAWRLSLATLASGCASGTLALTQTLYSKPGPTGTTELPLTRADLYR
jgi:cyclopropane-fatty-acyl-phospholipid synthase